MKKLVPIICLMFVTGCANYMVDVNGFAQQAKPLPQAAAVYVASHPTSTNPLFDQEIRHKIEYLVRQRCFSTVESEDKAQLYIDFKLGVNSRIVAGYSEPYYPTSYYYGYYWPYNFEYPYYTYDTVYDQWMMVKLYYAAPGKKVDEHDLLWVGEGITSRYSANLREAVNFLLAGIFEYFAQDTNHRVTVGFKNKDPQIVALKQQK